ncbi:hypothetical protein Lal_00032218 [Lupinus albus]|nr:hypothetical protein Lal_00032218 [Lupinus albus]
MDNGMMNVVSAIQDPSSPFFMSANENLGAILVSTLLNGDNYHGWARAMAMSLKTKNKIEFIN